jgi:S-DNA-T family DNA segregation ATPase FtsK/SpoIIIE
MANRLKTARKTPDPGKLTTEKVEKLAIKEVVKDERTHKITGAVLLMLCFFFFVAFTSYLFTWKEDYDKVFQHGISILKPNEFPISNLLGSFGAYISHLFINKGFGLASFLFCSFLFVTGANLLFNKKIFSVSRNIKYLVSGLFVFSLSLAFVFRGFEFPFGGEVGKIFSNWFVGLIGNVGQLFYPGCLPFLYDLAFNPVHIPSFNFPKRTSVDIIELPGEQGERMK